MFSRQKKEEIDPTAELNIRTIVAGDALNFPSYGDCVCVHYVGWLDREGTMFDNSYNRKQALFFKVGSGQAIAAFELALIKMSRGQKIKLVAPSHLAYGEVGYPPIIPGNSALKFEIELISFSTPVFDENLQRPAPKNSDDQS
jgi:FK506-binding protein 1